MRSFVLAGLVALAATPAQAAVTADEEAFVRCQVDFDIAYELLVPAPASGQSEDQAIAELDPDLAAVARGLRDLSREASLEIVGWTHHTSSDSARLAEVEKAEESELGKLAAAAETDADWDSLSNLVLDRVETCGARFFPDL